MNWTELEIISTEAGLKGDTEGNVHFRAHYQTSEGSDFIEENSLFGFENGKWLYCIAVED